MRLTAINPKFISSPINTSIYSVPVPINNHIFTVDPNLTTRGIVFSNVNNDGGDNNSRDNEGQGNGDIYGDLDQDFTAAYEPYIASELAENIS
ncbi:unnamed protein product [Cunninghamella echinulata]